MKPILRPLVFILLLLSGISFSVDVSDCVNITSPETYVLTADLVGAPNNATEVYFSTHGWGLNWSCIKIGSDDVILDCDGYSITNDGTADSTGIAINSSAVAYTNVTIRNCPSISGYTIGVTVYNTNDSRVENTTSSTNTDIAFQASGSGFVAYYSTRIDFVDVVAYNNTEEGIFADSSTSITVNDSFAYDNGGEGIYFTQVNNGTLSGNEVYDNTGYGIDLATSSYNLIANNLLYGNSRGVYLTNADRNTIHNNTAHDNGYGIHNFISDHTVCTDNTAYDNTQYGIYFQLSDNATIYNNTAYGNTFDGFQVALTTNSNVELNRAYDNSDGFDISAGSTDINLTDNIALFNSQNAFRFSSSDNILVLNSTAQGSNVGAYIRTANITASTFHLYNNSGDLRVLTDGSVGSIINATDVTFDNPAGGFQNYTNLSMNDGADAGEDYTITWSGEPAPIASGRSFEQKFVNITVAAGTPVVDEIHWHWTDAESASYTESSFQLQEYDGSWAIVNDTPDTVGNVFSLFDHSTFSTFAIVEITDINDCRQISAPGVYDLVADLYGAPQYVRLGLSPGLNEYNLTTCIHINSSDVVLNCNGYTLTENMPDTPRNYTTGVYMGSAYNTPWENITVNGCYAADYDAGFYASAIENSTLFDNTGFNSVVGVALRDPAAFALYGSNVHVLGNNALDSERGILLGLSNSNVSGNTIAGNTLAAVSAGGFDYINFTGNIVESNGNGWSERGDSTHVIIKDNIFRYNTGSALALEPLDDAMIDYLIDNNTIHDNGNGIVFDAYFEDDNSGNNLTNNLIYNHAGVGIGITFANADTRASPFSLMENNTLYSNNLDFTSDYVSTGDLTTSIFTNTVMSVIGFNNHTISSAAPPGPLPPDTLSFNDKYVLMENVSQDYGPIGEVRFHYNDTELGTTPESSLRVYRWNGVVWNFVPNQTVNDANNYVSVQGLADFSIFGLFSLVPPSGDGGGPSGPGEGLDISVGVSGEGYVVTVGDEDGDPVENAFVEVTDSLGGDYAQYTNESGQAYFTPCGVNLTVTAVKSGYSKETWTGFVECVPFGECVDDDECPEAFQCINNTCVPVECPDGVVIDHVCVPYECMVNTDCPEGQICVGHQCVPGCDSDDDCLASQYCNIPEGQQGGSCDEVECTCGMIGEHECIEYECCADEDCPEGMICLANKCAETGLECPSSGFIGDDEVCNAKQDGEACANCDIQITGPDGRSYYGKTYEDGTFEVPLRLKGTYNVTLLKEGQVVRTINVEALPRPVIDEGERPTLVGDLTRAFLLVVLLVLLALALIYLRRRHGEKMARPKP